MNLSEPDRAGHAAGAARGTECPERHDLLQRLKQAFDDFSEAVRESREHGLQESERSQAARSVCASVWAELSEHQNKHGCWRRS
jgi:hypothetical protein